MGQEQSKPPATPPPDGFVIHKPIITTVPEYPYQLTDVSIAVIGPSGCGKSALINSLAQKSDPESDHDTEILRDRYFEIGINGILRLIHIVDVKGITSYTSQYPVQSVAIVYSITDRKSFEDLDNWKKAPVDMPAPRLILIGNKSDLESDRKVSTDEGQEYAKKIGADFFETSTVNGSHPVESFQYLINKCLVNRELWIKISKEISGLLFRSLAIEGLVQIVMEYVDEDIHGIQKEPHIVTAGHGSCLIS